MININRIKTYSGKPVTYTPTQSTEKKVVFKQIFFSYCIWSNNDHLITSFSCQMCLSRVNCILLEAFTSICKIALNRISKLSKNML